MASTASSDLNSHAGTLDLTDYIERANAATGSSSVPDSSRRYGGPTVHHYKFAIIGCLVGFSLVIVAVVLSSTSLQKSNQALALAMTNTKAIESDKLIYVNNAVNPESLGSGVGLGGSVLSNETPLSPTPKPTSTPTQKPTTAQPTSDAPTETHLLDPQWFQTTHEDYQVTADANESAGTHSFHVANLFCLRHNRFLCNYESYCPNGKGSAPFKGGPPKTHNWHTLQEMQWAPYYTPDDDVDVGTHWVQIGLVPASSGGSNENSFAKCWKYDEWTLGGGINIEDVSEEEHRMWLLCCEKS